MIICHRCDNPPCCELSHLFLGTHADNAQDRKFKGRSNTQIRADHPAAKLTEEQVADMRRLRATGVYYKDLGAMFGVCTQQAHRVCARIAWR